MNKTTKEIIKEVKTTLVYDYYGEDDINESYLGNVELAWKDFVDNQVMGNCQYICQIVSEIDGVDHVFGEIEVDYPTYEDVDEYDDDVDDYIEVEKENYLLTHHWVTINGIIYEFSKGTLKEYIDWDDLYDVDCDDESRYKPLY